MPGPTLYIRKQAPFLRLIIPYMCGIIVQWYCKPPAPSAWVLFFSAITALIVFNLRLTFIQFHFGWANGVFIHTLFFSLGVLIAYHQDISHHPAWINNYYHDSDFVIVTIEEPLSERAKSFKAGASVNKVIDNGVPYEVKGNILLYFEKDDLLQNLQYGRQIIFNKPLQPIKNSGNPGTFNYQRYAAFQDVYQQVYLKPGEFAVLPGKKENLLKKILFAVRQRVLHIITNYITGEKEAGLAEALLIGYKDDLDKTLVQSYSNTGVVHIIAISGLHLGLIYWLLNLLLGPLKKRKKIKWLTPVLIIAGLWLFALLAGGGPSILRSAVMFTFIVVAERIERKTFIYNSLAASAFILLCINPFWLWDVGFQLSYLAVLSIVIFMKPIYNWFYFKNKMVDTVWKLNAVTVAAQILTVPVSIYHFHQFPNYFLFTNILAVPLSSLIVLGEILLCFAAFIPAVAKITGQLLQLLIRLMNGFIEHMESLPFALWSSMQVNIPQLICMYGAVAGIAYWLLQKNKTALVAALGCLLGFIAVRTWSFIEASQQQKLVVYNVPRYQAIDFISGRNYFFTGDEELTENDLLQNFHLRPNRILCRVNNAASLPSLLYFPGCWLFNNKRLVVIDESCRYNKQRERIKADVVVLSKNPGISIADLVNIFDCRQLVLDGSNAPWKVDKWKADCQKLGLACYSVVDKGAFVMSTD